MSHLSLCTTRIQQVRVLASDPELAYAARTRLRRAVLACTQLVARRAGLREPRYPGRYDLPPGAPPELRRICEITNRLLDRSQSICQPSEPLDDRWSDGWSEILAQLDELERSLPGVEQGTPNTPLQPPSAAAER